VAVARDGVEHPEWRSTALSIRKFMREAVGADLPRFATLTQPMLTRSAHCLSSKRYPPMPRPPAQPILPTERLVLRPFDMRDAPEVRRLAGAHEIADTTLHIPHPYGEGIAEGWIGSHASLYESGQMVTFAVTEADTQALVGAIGLGIVEEHARAELGYWFGAPYWGRGYATEAAAEILRFGFDDLELHRIFASHFVRNPASGRVLRKVGMLREGKLRQHVRKWGVFEDLETFAIVVDEWRQASGAGG
jgi:[ribosomal protein S5]-alanine N-acetyltransferase